MSLYSELAEVYDEVFPPSQASFSFINSLPGEPGCHAILDLGCATGTFLHFFKSQGIQVAGIELDQELCARAQANLGENSVFHGSMLDAAHIIPEAYGTDFRFDVITCLGNTLPHITTNQINSLFETTRRLLTSNGWLVIQTLNYSNPSIKPGFEFPLIKTQSAEFSRSYEEGSRPDSLIFTTELKVRGKIFKHKTTLFPVGIPDLDRKLAASGFNEIQHFADWYRGTFDLKTSIYAITIAKKGS